MGILNKKQIVVMGVANKKSIAYGCYQALKDQGAKVILTYQNPRMKKSIEKITPVDQPMVECDVSSDTNVKKAFETIETKYGKIDGVIHAIAYADRETLTNPLIKVSKDGYNLAEDISAYSFIAVSRYAMPILNNNGSILTLTYIGSTKVIPQYGMMGIAKASLEAIVKYLAVEMGKNKKQVRVNAISAGPVKTLAISGVKNHSKMLKLSKEMSIDNEGITTKEVGNVAAFLESNLASGVTGDIIYVDKGIHLF